MPAPRVRDRPLLAMGDPPRHEDCWAKTTKGGKPGISVRDHCLNVGCVAEALLALLPQQLYKLIPPGAATLAALHDIGKVSPGFQRKSEAWLVDHALRDQALKEGWSVRESDHARISQFTVQELLRSSRLQLWAAGVGAHHAKIKGEQVHLREPWEEERLRLATELIGQFGPLPNQPPDEAALWFAAGLITIADWIGSDERHFPLNARWDVPERRGQAPLSPIRLGPPPFQTDRKIPSEWGRRGGIKGSALSRRHALQPVRYGLSRGDNRCRGLRALPFPRPGCMHS